MPAVGDRSDEVGWDGARQPDDTQEIERVAPAGYRGRRRRGGTDAAPAEPLIEEAAGRGGRVLMTAAAVSVLLLVLTVWIRWPRDDGHASPRYQGPEVAETFPDGENQPAGPSTGSSASRSPGPTGKPSPTRSPTFTPVTVQAESATLRGKTAKAVCGTCSGGRKVRLIGAGPANDVTFTVKAPAAGPRRLAVTYELSGAREFQISVNGVSTRLPLTGSSWSTPATAWLSITLKAGSNTIRFFNDTADAPDLDKIAVS